jgi:hypothetical protein
MHTDKKLSHDRHTVIQETNLLHAPPVWFKRDAMSTFWTLASSMKRAWRFCRQLRPLSLSMAVILSFEACAADLNTIKHTHVSKHCVNDAEEQ